MKKDDRERCSWATTELYKEYHDEEWGKPVHDDRKLFEMLVLLEYASRIIMADDIK